MPDSQSTSPAAPPVTLVAQATTAPQDPDFTNLRSVKSITFRKKEVQMETFSFLGQDLRSPVNRVLSEKLRAAQRSLYALCLQEKKVGKIDVTTFAEWCWMGQAPFESDGITNKPAGVLGGMGLQGGGYHASGSAVDINLDYNPYIPLRCKGGKTYGGERQLKAFDPAYLKKSQQRLNLSDDEIAEYTASLPKGGVMSKALEAKIAPEAKRVLSDGVWKKCAEVYDKASWFFYGVDADVSEDPRGGPTMLSDGTPEQQAKQEYKRFKQVSDALRGYFKLLYKGKDQPVTFEVFKTTFMQKLNDGKFSKNVASLLPVTDLARVYAGGLADYETMKLGIVQGRLLVDTDGHITAPSYRDPRFGFLNIRQEVAVELMHGQGLRWGACMMGCGLDAGGDMMHFDLHGHVVD